MRFLLLILIFAAGELVADPKSHYMIHCMGCHLMDGQGQPPDVPVLDNELGHLIRTAAGREYLIRVPGAAQSPVNDAELAAVINWMLERYSTETLPASFRPYTEDEISRHRPNILADPVKFKAEISGR